MSRTFRRTQKHLIADRLGTMQRAIEGEWFYYRYRYEERCLTIEQSFKQAKARFHRDQHRGKWSCPSFYARMYNRADRQASKLDIHHHFRADSWDSQFTPVHLHGGEARSDWFW